MGGAVDPYIYDLGAAWDTVTKQPDGSWVSPLNPDWGPMFAGAKKAEDRGWHLVSGIELGLQPRNFGSGNSYAFANGMYQAQASVLTGIVTGPREANALVLSGLVDGKKTLAVAFRGTDQLPDVADFGNFADHYALFSPLTTKVKDFLAAHADVQLLAVGHSLGAAMAQYLVNDLKVSTLPSFDSRVRAVTIGSPGAEMGDAGNVINFLHSDDIVTKVAGLPIHQALDFGAAIAALVTGGVAAPLFVEADKIQNKHRSGSDVSIEYGT